MKNKFQNRESEMEKLLNPPSSLIMVYGEAGIGKTRLLKEAAARLRERTPSSLILWVDFDRLAELSPQPQADLLRLLIEEAEGELRGAWRTEREAAPGIVEQLTDRARLVPVVLIFDNTEALQEKGSFWRWLELHLIGPLLGGDSQVIFAGRIPQPWRRYEIRQALTALPLSPLNLETASNELIFDVLSQANPSLDVEGRRAAVTLINDLAFGHPGLSEKIASYVAPRWPPADLEAFQVEVCKEIVKPFIQETFFADVAPPWDDWLWYLSVLDWFDTTILPSYLKQLTPQKVEDKPDYYFIQEISHLRVKKQILWREERGDCMHGVIGKIVEQCLKILEPERYRRANNAAAETFADIAAQFEDAPDIQAQYNRQVNTYRKRARKA